MPNSIIRKSIYLILILILVSGCKKKEAYIFYNKDYYSVFKEKLKLYYIVKKSFYRNFFDLHEIKLRNLSFISSDLKKLTNKNGSVIYIENFFLPLVMEDSNFEINRDIKILTYNITNDIDINFKTLIYNIEIDENVYNKKIFSLVKKYSKDKNLNDCGIVADPKFYPCEKFISDSAGKNYNFQVFEASKENFNEIDNWLNNSDKKVIIFFANNFNSIILDKESSFNKKCIYIEIFTDFGKLSNIIDYQVEINWDEALSYALTQKKYKEFINTGIDDFVKKNNIKNNIYNAKLELSSLIDVKKNKKNNFNFQEEKK